MIRLFTPDMLINQGRQMRTHLYLSFALSRVLSLNFYLKDPQCCPKNTEPYAMKRLVPHGGSGHILPIIVGHS